jgi:hypothetical protein
MSAAEWRKEAGQRLFHMVHCTVAISSACWLSFSSPICTLDRSPEWNLWAGERFFFAGISNLLDVLWDQVQTLQEGGRLMKYCRQQRGLNLVSHLAGQHKKDEKV